VEEVNEKEDKYITTSLSHPTCLIFLNKKLNPFILNQHSKVMSKIYFHKSKITTLTALVCF